MKATITPADVADVATTALMMDDVSSQFLTPSSTFPPPLLDRLEPLPCPSELLQLSHSLQVVYKADMAAAAKGEAPPRLPRFVIDCYNDRSEGREQSQQRPNDRCLVDGGGGRAGSGKRL